MEFNSEKEFEAYIRNLIAQRIISKNKDLILLENKKAVDIIICKERPRAELFFIEIKFHIKKHGRLGFGSAKGRGFQPEILNRRPKYFEKNMRWIISAEHSEGIYFLTNKEILEYISGNQIGEKFNNIKNSIFASMVGLSERQLIQEMKQWLKLK